MVDRAKPKFKIGHSVSIPYFTGKEYCGPIMSVVAITDWGDHYTYRCLWMNCGDPRQACFSESEIKLVDVQVNFPDGKKWEVVDNPDAPHIRNEWKEIKTE